MTEINPKQLEKRTVVEKVPDYLRLITGSYEVNQFLDTMGIDHNPDSIVLEDSFNCVFCGNNPDTGEYEIYVCHKSVPYLSATSYKIDTTEINQYEVEAREL